MPPLPLLLLALPAPVLPLPPISDQVVAEARSGDADALIRTSRALTTAEQGCPAIRDSSDITVCGLRRADRFRVPLIEHDPGDPRYRSVHDERQALLHRTTPIEDKSIFLVGGGMAGVSMTIGQDGGTTVRKPAP